MRYVFGLLAVIFGIAAILQNSPGCGWIAIILAIVGFAL